MKKETTPARISDKIVELCGQVVPGIEYISLKALIRKSSLESVYAAELHQSSTENFTVNIADSV